MARKIIFPAGILLALVPFVLFPVCDFLRPDGSHMACYFSGIFITIMGVLIAFLSLPKKFPAARLILVMLCALSCWLVPNKIISVPPFGLCANPEHLCRASTMPVVGVLVIVIVAVCVACIILDFVRGK